MVPSAVVSTMSMSGISHDSSTSYINPVLEPPKRRRPPGTSSDTMSSDAAVATHYQGPAREMKVFSREEISQHRTEDDAWIVVDGKVYDVTQFLSVHPGGEEFILEHLQSKAVIQDAGPLMRGQLGGDAHRHSQAAFRMLEQFLIGSVDASHGFPAEASQVGNPRRHTVDLKKPIVPQVGRLGADYDKWVHDPVVCKESPRFFENDICEFLTRTRWWVIPMVWSPVAFGMYYEALANEGLHVSRLPVLCPIGVAIWSMLEYLLHRFIFHMKSSSYWWNTLHYILHGFHHKHPMDGARLVFPPLFTAIICSMIWLIASTLPIPYASRLVLFASGLLAYVGYDLTHYFLHFGDAFSDETRRMKRYHLNHHFKDQTNGYGITSNVWDFVFGTLPLGEDKCYETAMSSIGGVGTFLSS